MFPSGGQKFKGTLIGLTRNLTPTEVIDYRDKRLTSPPAASHSLRMFDFCLRILSSSIDRLTFPGEMIDNRSSGTLIGSASGDHV